MTRYNFTIRSKLNNCTIHFALDNSYWNGLERLDQAERTIASDLAREEKQRVLAQIFSPHSYTLVERKVIEEDVD